MLHKRCRTSSLPHVINSPTNYIQSQQYVSRSDTKSEHRLRGHHNISGAFTAHKTDRELFRVEWLTDHHEGDGPKGNSSFTSSMLPPNRVRCQHIYTLFTQYCKGPGKVALKTCKNEYWTAGTDSYMPSLFVMYV